MSSQRPPRPVGAMAPVASSASSQKIAVVESEFAADHPSTRTEWQRAHYYHLFPATPRYPVSVYLPSRSSAPAELPIAHRRPVPESCGVASTRGLRIRGAPGRLTHIKGTACVVMAIALIFIVVLVLALVSNRQNS